MLTSGGRIIWGTSKASGAIRSAISGGSTEANRCSVNYIGRKITKELTNLFKRATKVENIFNNFSMAKLIGTKPPRRNDRTNILAQKEG